MIYIHNDSKNNIITRFGDRRKSSTSYFYWVVTNNFNCRETSFIMEDISPNPCAYNLFEFTHIYDVCEENGNPIYTEGDVTMFLTEGHNTYKVYEITDLELSLDSSIGLIEEDIMFVQMENQQNQAHFDQSNIYY